MAMHRYMSGLVGPCRICTTLVAPQRADRIAAIILLLPAYADSSRGQILGNLGRSLKQTLR